MAELMSEIQDLLRRIDERKTLIDHTYVRTRVDRGLVEELRTRLERDGISIQDLVRAVFRGYVDSNPALLAFVDDIIRSRKRDEKRGPAMVHRDLDDIYATIGSGMMTEDDQ